MEERAEEVERIERVDRDARRTGYWKFIPEYVLWFVTALVIMFWSFRFADPEYATIELWTGILLGDAGMLWVLVRWQAYWEKHGLF